MLDPGFQEGDEPKGKIVTFYSYKGGVGRSMSLANIAVLLAHMGKSVLVVDWDLEAPGLDRFFAKQKVTSPSVPGGLMSLLRRTKARSKTTDVTLDNRALYGVVGLPTGHEIHILPSGDTEASYGADVAAFSWNDFFSKCRGGEAIEDLRQTWRREYDFTLIDSRTGITDSGGVCTVQLPDYLVLVFAANDQNLDGSLRVIRGIHASRAEFGFDRQRLLVVPLLSRFDGRAEKALADDWLIRCAEVMDPLLGEWLPGNTSPLDYFDKTKLPHIPKYAFGEQLAVLEERPTDTDALTYYYSAIARLLASHLKHPARHLALPQTISEEEKKAILRRAAEWKKSRETIAQIERLVASLPAGAREHAEAMRAQIRTLVPIDASLCDDLESLTRSTTDPGEQREIFMLLASIEGCSREGPGASSSADDAAMESPAPSAPSDGQSDDHPEEIPEPPSEENLEEGLDPFFSDWAPGKQFAGSYCQQGPLVSDSGIVRGLFRDGVLGKNISLHFCPRQLRIDRKVLGEIRQACKRSGLLVHPNIERVYGLVEGEDLLAIATDSPAPLGGPPDVPATSLGMLLHEQGHGFSLKQLQIWVPQMTRALDAAHQIGICHGNLIPSNFFNPSPNNIFVGGFIYSLAISNVSARAGHPELHRGMSRSLGTEIGGPPNKADDIFQFGVLLIELLLGRSVMGAIDLAKEYKQAHGALPERLRQENPSKLPEAWHKAIQACVQADAAKRPVNFREVYHILPH